MAASSRLLDNSRGACHHSVTDQAPTPCAGGSPLPTALSLSSSPQQVTSRTKSLNKHVLGAPPAAQVGVSAPRGKRPVSHCVPLVPDRQPQAAADLPGGLLSSRREAVRELKQHASVQRRGDSMEDTQDLVL
ncbi:hypothetical protein FALCPG4_004788 [Fusarium falciforme]